MYGHNYYSKLDEDASYIIANSITNNNIIITSLHLLIVTAAST